MADSGLRQILVLQKLPREPRTITSKAICSYLTGLGYPVSLRTIQRDLETLSTIFPIIEPSKCNGGGWSINRDYSNKSIPIMEPYTALTLLMAQQHLRSLLPQNILKGLRPYTAEAKATLNALEGNTFKEWSNKIRIIPNSPLLPCKKTEDSIHLICEALLHNKKILATYKDKKDRVVSPYGIVQRGNQFYLICTFFDFTDIRITALQRYSEVVISDESFTTHINFNLDDYISNGEMAWPWDGYNPISLHLEVNNWLASYLNEFPLSADQSIQAAKTDGWHCLTASVLDTHELREWLMSKGNVVKIIQPLNLRSWIIAMTQEVGELYH